MSIPHRIFTRFHHISAHGYGASNFNSYDKWLNDHVTEPIVGLKKINFAGTIWERYDLLYKGTEDQGWGELSGADKVMSVVLTASFLPPFYNSKPITKVTMTRRGTLYRNADDWSVSLGTGRYTDGASAQYFDYPHDYHAGDITMIGTYTDILISSFPARWDIWHEAWNAFGNTSLSYSQSSYILTRGMILGPSVFTPETITWGTGNGIFFNVDLHRAKIKYFNPICNSLSRYSGPDTGGFELLFYGLGFYNPESEIDEGGFSRFADVGSYWNDKVDYIYIEDLNGNVVATLEKDIDGAPGSRDFSVDSNSQITLRSFPALGKGIYQFRLKKVMSLVGSPIAEGYAGDWRCDDDGRMRTGDRIYFYIGERTSFSYSKWKWKKGDDFVFRYYAPIDVRTTLVFYEGKILSTSPFTRGVNETTGIPIFSDIEVVLDNTDREFSKLLAEYSCKNQVVEFYFGYQLSEDVISEAVFRGYVYDHTKPTSVFRVKLRNVLDKYFATRLPKYFATIEEYPDVHPNHVGREIPEVLGLAQLTTTAQPGAVEAIYVDVVNFEYLASRGSLHAITEVYADGVLIDPADYTIVYKDGGRTYILFDGDQGDAKITFNAEGYMYGDWDSANGYVQNPIYIILFLLGFFAEIPEDDIDFASFDDLAILYDDLGYGESGYYILQDEKDASSALAELLYTYGVKLWVNAEGRIKIGKKLISDLSATTLLYSQIDLIDEAEKPMGFDEAVNYAKASFAHYPSANLYVGSTEARRQSSIDFFEKEISPKSPWLFPWTADSALVAMRLEEELLKLGFGDQKISFSMSIEHFDDLDILETFLFQDPHAISLTGLGEEARYYYVESLSYDMIKGTIRVEGIDLQWLIRQYLLLGDETLLALNWNVASETDRTYAYLADETTGTFDDTEPGKILIDENLL